MKQDKEMSDNHKSSPFVSREMVLAACWAFATMLFSFNVVGAKLFVVYIYGWTKVQHDGLRLLGMPKGKPWPVSNGDVITQDHFVHYLIGAASWFVLIAAYPIARVLLAQVLKRGNEKA